MRYLGIEINVKKGRHNVKISSHFPNYTFFNSCNLESAVT